MRLGQGLVSQNPCLLRRHGRRSRRCSPQPSAAATPHEPHTHTLTRIPTCICIVYTHSSLSLTLLRAYFGRVHLLRLRAHYLWLSSLSPSRILRPSRRVLRSLFASSAGSEEERGTSLSLGSVPAHAVGPAAGYMPSDNPERGREFRRFRSNLEVPNARIHLRIRTARAGESEKLESLSLSLSDCVFYPAIYPCTRGRARAILSLSISYNRYAAAAACGSLTSRECRPRRYIRRNMP